MVTKSLSIKNKTVSFKTVSKDKEARKNETIKTKSPSGLRYTSRRRLQDEERSELKIFLKENFEIYLSIIAQRFEINDFTNSILKKFAHAMRFDDTLFLEVIEEYAQPSNPSPENGFLITELMQNTPIDLESVILAEKKSSMLLPVSNSQYLTSFDINHVQELKDGTSEKRAYDMQRSFLSKFGCQEREGTGDFWRHFSITCALVLSHKYTIYSPIEVELESLNVGFKILNLYSYKTRGLPITSKMRTLSVYEDSDQLRINSNIGLLFECLSYDNIALCNGVFIQRFHSKLVRQHLYYAAKGGGIMNGISKNKGKYNSYADMFLCQSWKIKCNKVQADGNAVEQDMENQVFQSTYDAVYKEFTDSFDTVETITPGYTNMFHTLLKGAETVNDLTLRLSTLGYFRYPPIFLSSDICVAHKKNLGVPKNNKGMTIKRTETYEGFPFRYNFDDYTERVLCNYINDVISPALDKIDVNSINLLNDLFALQTTSVAYDKGAPDVDSKTGRIQSVKKRRVGDFLTNDHKIGEDSQLEGEHVSIGLRYQVGRDARSVFGITTNHAIGSAYMYLMLSRLIPHIEAFSASKTTSTMSDTIDMLVATSDEGTATFSLDVSGADTSAVDNIFALDFEMMLRGVMLPQFQGKNSESFYNFITKVRETSVSEHGYETKGRRTVKTCEMMSWQLAKVLQMAKMSTDKNEVSDLISFVLDRFTSGVPTTSLAHTLRFHAFIYDVKNDFYNTFKNFKLRFNILGDDIKVHVIGPKGEMNAAVGYLQIKLSNTFSHFGFGTTGNVHTHYAEYLMQFVLFGQEVDPAFRIAYLTSEKPSPAVTNSFANRFDALIAISNESIPRIRNTKIVSSLLLAFMSVGSLISIGSLSKKDISEIEKCTPVHRFFDIRVEKKRNVKDGDSIRMTGYIFLPFHFWFMPYVNKLSGYSCTIKSGDKESSLLFPNQLIRKSNTISHLFYDLYKLPEDKIKTIQIKSSNDFINNLAELHKLKVLDINKHLDHERLLLDGHTFMFDLSKIDIAVQNLEGAKKEVRSDPELLKLISRGDKYVDADKSLKSLRAARDFKNLVGISVPDSEIYAHKARTRIEDSITLTSNEERESYVQEFPKLIMQSILGINRILESPKKGKSGIKKKPFLNDRTRIMVFTKPVQLEDDVYSYCRSNMVKMPLIQSMFDPYLRHLNWYFPRIINNGEGGSLILPYENLQKQGIRLNVIEDLFERAFFSRDPYQARDLLFDALQPSPKVRQSIERYLDAITHGNITSSGVSLSPKTLFQPDVNADNSNFVTGLFDHVTNSERIRASRALAVDYALNNTFKFNKIATVQVPA